MGVGLALLAAALFGATVPLGKILLGDLPPLAVAALFYLGCGIGLAAIIVLRRLRKYRIRFVPSHRLPFAWSVLSGGIVAPILFTTGLARTSSASAALLLNLEAVFTILFSRLFLREAVGGPRLIGMLLVVAGAAVLGLNAHSWSSFSWRVGDWLVAGASLGWALDNILTRHVAHSDALVMACVKGLVAGLVDLAILWGYAGGRHLPWAAAGAGLIVGFLGYGLSLVCFIVALRTLGAARTSSYFASAPFVGAGLAIGFGQARVTQVLALASLLALSGIVLMITDCDGNHRHWHRHRRGRLDHHHPDGVPRTFLGWHAHRRKGESDRGPSSVIMS